MWRWDEHAKSAAPNAYADVGQFSPIRLDSPEGKREVLLALDVHASAPAAEEGAGGGGGGGGAVRSLVSLPASLRA